MQAAPPLSEKTFTSCCAQFTSVSQIVSSGNLDAIVFLRYARAFCCNTVGVFDARRGLGRAAADEIARSAPTQRVWTSPARERFPCPLSRRSIGQRGRFSALHAARWANESQCPPPFQSPI